MGLLILPRRFRDSKPIEVGPIFNVGMKGEYKVQICRNGHVVREPFGPKMIPNLILNSGIDYFMSTNAARLFGAALNFARIGSGTNTPAVTDTALQAQLKSTSTLTGSGSTFTNDLVNGTWTPSWSYEFAAEVGTVTYNELGLGALSTTNLITRAVFPGPVTLNNGDNMRLVYNFTYSIPATVTQIPVSLAAVNGFNCSGNLKVIGSWNAGNAIFGNVLGTDTSTTTNMGGGTVHAVLCGGAAGQPYLLSAPTVFPAVNTNLTETVISGSVGTTNLGTYTNGSFTRNATATWTPSQPASTVSNVNMIALGTYISNAQMGLYLLLTSAQTKANTNTLTITWSTTLSRV